MRFALEIKCKGYAPEALHACAKTLPEAYADACAVSMQADVEWARVFGFSHRYVNGMRVER